MKAQVVKTKRTFLVLMDFSEASYSALKYAITAAKSMDGSIHVLHVGEIKDLDVSDSTVVALREFTRVSQKIENKLDSIIEIIKAEGVDATYEYFFGNLVKTLEEHMDLIKADLVVVGKKREKRRLSGRLTTYLLTKYSGSTLIVGEAAEFHIESKISLGCTNKMLVHYNPVMAFEFEKQVKNPITFLTVVDPTESEEKLVLPLAWRSIRDKQREFQFEHKKSATVVEGIVQHISEQNIELLCLGRGKRRNFLQDLFFSRRNVVSKLVKAVQIPILVMGINAK
jgi:nucleotide-binding universal stress UspA family protein